MCVFIYIYIYIQLCWQLDMYKYRSWIYYQIGGLDHEFYCSIYWDSNIIPTDEIIFFRGVQTTKQINIDPGKQGLKD